MPRNRLVNACCAEVNSRRASASVSAAITLHADHRVGLSQLRRGLEPLAIDLRAPASARRARSATRTRTAGPASPRAARRTGSTRGSRAARSSAGARHGLDPLARLQRPEQRLQLQHVLRERVGVGRVAAQRAQGELVRARRPAEAEIDAARIERFERAELLGDDQRRVVRQHDAARADPDRPGAARDVADHDRGRRARDARPCCGARRASSAGSPSASACCARSSVLRSASARRRAVRRRARDREPRRGAWINLKRAGRERS